MHSAVNIVTLRDENTERYNAAKHINNFLALLSAANRVYSSIPKCDIVASKWRSISSPKYQTGLSVEIAYWNRETLTYSYVERASNNAPTSYYCREWRFRRELGRQSVIYSVRGRQWSVTRNYRRRMRAEVFDIGNCLFKAGLKV